MKLKNLPVHKLLLLNILSCLLLGCSVEVAPSEVNYKLRIVSNFLTPLQEGYFKKWEKKSGIKIEFMRLDTEQIRERIKTKPWDPGFDLVWLNGLNAYAQLNKIPFQERSPDFAQIPIGLSYVPDSLDQVKNFVELSKTNLWAAADDASYALLKAHFSFAYRNREKNQQQQKAYSAIIRGLKERQLAFNGANEYHTNMLLCRYDTYHQQLKPANRKQRILYPKFFKYQGVADRNIICIVRQAMNYSSAKRFQAYLQKQLQKNPKFCQKLGFKKIEAKSKLISSKALLNYLKK